MRKPLGHLRNLLRFSRGATIPTMGPLKAKWEVINTCNARCKTCLHWQEKSDDTILGTEEARVLISQLAEAGVLSLTLTGGEPMMRRDLVELIAFAKEQGLITELITNGLLLSERRARDLVESKLDTVYISIDAANAKLNDQLRGLSGYFKLAMSAVDNLKSMRRNGDLKIIIKTTVTSKNIGELVALAELAIKKGIDGFCFQLAQIAENRKFVFDSALLIDSSNRDALIAELDKLLLGYRETLSGPLEYYETLRNVLANPVCGENLRSVSGYSFVQLDAWGNVFMNPAKTRRIGTIREASFESIWFGQAANEIRNAEPETSLKDYLFDVTGTMSASFANLNVKRFLKVMRPILTGAKLF